MRIFILIVLLMSFAIVEARKKNTKHTNADEVERTPTTQSTKFPAKQKVFFSKISYSFLSIHH